MPEYGAQNGQLGVVTMISVRTLSQKMRHFSALINYLSILHHESLPKMLAPCHRAVARLKLRTTDGSVAPHQPTCPSPIPALDWLFLDLVHATQLGHQISDYPDIKN